MTRVLSALLLLPIVVGIVWFLPSIATLTLATVAAVLAVIEYAAIAAAVGAAIPRVLTAAAVAAACVAIGVDVDRLDVLILAASIIIASLAVATRGPGPSALASVAAAVFAVIYIGLPLGSIAAVHAMSGRLAVVLLMATIVISDSAQYYTGRAFGRSPLAPAISPKKTREGAVGGVIFGAAAMFAGGRYVFPEAPPVVLMATALAVVALGIVGDLFESLLKRSAGVKDSSALIPGHGGILDRIDSWLFAGPAYYVFVRSLQS
jgi:phosphatidate cytidylyltransferase